MNSFNSIKYDLLRSWRTYNLLTWVKKISWVFLYNYISLTSIVYASTTLMTLIMFISLIYILTLFLSNRSQTFFDRITFPWSYPIITLSSSYDISCWCVMLLISQRGVLNGSSPCLHILVPVLYVPVTIPLYFWFIHVYNKPAQTDNSYFET